MTNDLIRQYQETGSKEVEDQLFDLHKSYIQANINKWSGVLPEAVLQAYGKHYAKNAFKSFDPNKGGSINTHLYNHISQLSRRVYAANNSLSIPEHQIQMIGKVNSARDLLADELGRDPTVDEIADHLSLPKQHIAKVIKNQRADFLNDSDTDIQYQVGGDSKVADKIFGYRQALEDKQKEYFDALTGFGGTKPLTPQQFGKQFKMKPYEVSRLKAYFAKGLK
jgi:RNA polymerase primary sigma factor